VPFPDRAACPVLVPQADSLGALGVIRSLGRAGYPVHACSDRADALGLRSRYARTSRVHPALTSPEFFPWLRETLASLGIRAIVPSESFLLALRPHLSELQPLLPFFDPALFELAFSKADLFTHLSGDPHLPKGLVVEGSPPALDTLERLGSPLWVKGDAVHSLTGEPSRVLRAETPQEAQRVVSEWLHRYRRLLVQSHVEGIGLGVFLLRVDGQPRARFGHRRLHEVPHTGGVSSLRKSFRVPEVERHALQTLQRVGWNGVAMLEYRWQPGSGDFRLLELNARFWGSLHLALAAGVDFPRLLLDAWLGAHEPEPRWKPGVRCRNTVPGELEHLWSVLKDPQLPLLRKARSVGAFAALSLDPRVHADLSFPGDRRLYLREATGWARQTGATLVYRARPRLKSALYAGARAVGLFTVSRFMTRDALRIVCWHGTSLGEEQARFPSMFLSPDLLERRLLALHRYPVLPLEEAVRRLADGTLPPASVALTIDDGFFGTLRHAWPALQRHGFPATLYVTSYHAEKRTPVFRLLVQWIFLSTPAPLLDLSALGLGMVGTLPLEPGAARDEGMWRIIRHAEQHLDEPGRQELADRLGMLLDVDLAPVRTGRWLSLATPDELAAAAREGLDLQLHTHRHRFPLDRGLALRELRDNRAVLEPLAGQPLRHFCYPSGYVRPGHLSWLAEAGVLSATTCEPGLNRPGDSPYTLRRFLDGSQVSQLEFEAELSGFTDLLRRLRGGLDRLRGTAPRLEAAVPLGSEVPDSGVRPGQLSEGAARRSPARASEARSTRRV
jgi:peptidoglycan/xylan/chitin deacetylase (PgdA/CDA1 family)